MNLNKKVLLNFFFLINLILCLENNGRTNETILQELTEKHKQRLTDEKSKFQDLTSILDDYKVNNLTKKYKILIKNNFKHYLGTSSKYRRSIIFI